jgi:hypothetical protein
MALCATRRNDCRSSLSRFRFFLVVCWLRRSLLPPQLRTHGSQRSTTEETSRNRAFLAQCGHRGVEPCEGILQYHACQARVCLLERYPHHDQSGFISASPALIDCRLIESTQESMTNEEDCVELGLACADVCTALSRGLNGKLLKDLNNSVSEAINQLTAWVKPAVISWNTSLTILSTVAR